VDHQNFLGVSAGAMALLRNSPSSAEIEAEIERRRIELERETTLRNADAIRARCKTLIGFVREAWPHVVHGQPYVHGWHIDILAAHLEAVTYGTLLAHGLDNRIWANVPPGMMKSLLFGVLWPAFEWGPMNKPHMQYLTTSWSGFYADRDAGKMYDLINSEWYQTLWGDQVGDISGGRTYFRNTKGGFRQAMPFGSLTGGRADRVIIDDPHSTEGAESDADRETATRIFRESVPSRINDIRYSAILGIMQRLRPDDLSGVIDSMRLPYLRIVLPMRLDPKRRFVSPLGAKFSDPRTQPGEFIFPERYPQAYVERVLELQMTAYAIAGQHEQEPTPREGGMFKRHWFIHRIKIPPVGIRWVTHFDLAATEEIFSQTGTARTAGVLMGATWPRSDGKIYIADCRAERLEIVDSWLKVIAAEHNSWAIRQRGSYEISLPQDPGQSGKTQKRGLGISLAGYDVNFVIEGAEGSKPTRATALAAQAEIGNVILVEGTAPEQGAWITPFLDEICLFPAKPNDRGDAASGAYSRLLKPPRYRPQFASNQPLALYGR
jgi:phage terminase large subunit-like protein